MVHIPFHGCYGTADELEKMKREPVVSYHKIEKGQSLFLDTVNIIIEDLTNESISFTIPYQAGIIVNEQEYRKKQPSKVLLKLGQKCVLHRDVYDAMESWEISLVENEED